MKTRRTTPPQTSNRVLPVEHLNPKERSHLQELEKVIQGGLRTFFEVGHALGEIREKRLYRDSHQTFEAYCREKWEISRVHAHRLVAAAEVRDVLAEGDLPLPETEGQIRALTLLPRKQIPLVWASVINSAGTTKVTARLVKTVLQEMHLQSRSSKSSAVRSDENWQSLVRTELDRISASLKSKNPDEILFSVEKIKLIVEELVLLQLNRAEDAA